METMKTWRSKLKKTGASALAAFMLCGSFSAFAQEPGGETTSGEGITTNSTTGDADKAGNVKTVTGYQTDRAVGYAANIEWGNMVFVYDRGKYDPTTGALVGSFPELSENVEAGATVADDGKVTSAGYWYGFDGENNEVYIENLSTEAINITATPLVNGERADKAKFSLYVDATKGWNGVSTAEKTFSGYALSALKVGTAVGKDGVEGAGEINRNFAAAQRKDDGSIIEDQYGNRSVDYDKILLNITGRPKDDFKNQKDYTSDGEKGEKLGTITLSFKTIATADNEEQKLTPKKVVVEEEEETPEEQG